MVICCCCYEVFQCLRFWKAIRILISHFSRFRNGENPSDFSNKSLPFQPKPKKTYFFASVQTSQFHDSARYSLIVPIFIGETVNDTSD